MTSMPETTDERLLGGDLGKVSRMWGGAWGRFLFPGFWLVYLGSAISYVANHQHGWAGNASFGYVLGFVVAAGVVGELARRGNDRNVLSAIGLPVSYPQERWPALLDAMRVDKKARGNRLRFVALAGLAKPVMLEDPDPGLLTAAYSELSS